MRSSPSPTASRCCATAPPFPPSHARKPPKASSSGKWSAAKSATFFRGARQRPIPAPKPALQVENLTVADPRTGAVVLHDISFSVAAGEVLGIGGLMGAGRTELLMHLFGAWGTRLSGRVLLHGRALPAGQPRRALRRGLALVSEDRRRYGLVLEESVSFNLSLSSLRGLLINHAREYQTSERTAKSLQVKAPEPLCARGQTLRRQSAKGGARPHSAHRAARALPR